VLWSHGTVFSVHLSDNGQDFSEVGRITTGDGDADSFWWRSTTARYFRLTVHEASASEGAVVDELKLRILNKDRMPIGALERAAAAGRGEPLSAIPSRPANLLDRARRVRCRRGGEIDKADCLDATPVWAGKFHRERFSTVSRRNAKPFGGSCFGFS
jgi:hypothetical protein